MESAIRMCHTMLETHSVTGLLVDSPCGAIGCLKALHERNLSVPHDISLVAGGIHPHLNHLVPSIVHVASDFASTMRTATRIIQSPQACLGKEIKTEILIHPGDSVAQVSLPGRAEKVDDFILSKP